MNANDFQTANNLHVQKYIIDTEPNSSVLVKTMEIDIGNMILELGYGLGAAIVLYMMYNRMNRMNERTNELQATLADTVMVMREHASSAPDVKSATLRAAEMDRLYQANHQMMIDGHATIIDGIPASVEQLSDEQHAMAESVNGLTSGLNAFATSSLEQQRKMHVDLQSLQAQATGSAAAQVELVEQLTANVASLDNQLELVTRALMQMAKSNETFQSASSNAIANIERKLMEEF